jgi:hypothetical protein
VRRRTLGLSEEYTRRFGAELAKLGCPLGEVEKPGMPPKLPDPADAANPNQASLPEQDLLNRRYPERPKLGQALRASTIIIPACSSISSPKPVTA